MSIRRGPWPKSFQVSQHIKQMSLSSLCYIASFVFSSQASHVVSQRELMLITQSMWPLDGTALQSSCLGMFGKLTAFVVLQQFVYLALITNPLNLWSQGSIWESSGHVVSGLHLRRTKRWAASVSRREWDWPALYHPESLGTPATRTDEALL